MLVLMSGCSGLQVSDANSLALQIAAQRAGFYVGQNNPEIVPHAKLVADGILAQEGNAPVKTALNLAITELAKQFPDDPAGGRFAPDCFCAANRQPGNPD